MATLRGSARRGASGSPPSARSAARPRRASQRAEEGRDRAEKAFERAHKQAEADREAATTEMTSIRAQTEDTVVKVGPKRTVNGSKSKRSNAFRHGGEFFRMAQLC